MQVLKDDLLDPLEMSPSQRSVLITVASAEPRAKVNVTTLDDQGPCEGLLIGPSSSCVCWSRYQRRSRTLEPPHSVQHNKERARLDTCVACAFTCCVQRGVSTIGHTVS